MVCRLCLTESVYNIAIFSEEKIKQYIEKFLNLEFTPDDPISKVICAFCWQQLEDFHNFCFRVDEAQRTLLSAVFEEVKKPPSDNEIPVDTIDTDKFLGVLKEEENSSDEIYGFHSVTENTVKDELFEEEISEAPKANELLPTGSVTGGSKLKKKQSPEKERHPDIRVKRKCVEMREKQQTYKNEKSCINAKRKSGLQGTEEERLNIEKVRSEKFNKMLETAKELDEIIQKNMNLTCNICTESLIDFSELERHFRAVHKRKGYAVCCNKKLHKRIAVVDHINTHINPDHFKCTDCGKVMADRKSLRRHVLSKHQKEDDKMYQCSYCPKKYAKQYLLTQHEVKHIAQKGTFTCTECERGYSTKSRLTQHQNQVHSRVYDKMCEICAKIIRGKASFKYHMEGHGKVQAQVQCEICSSWLKDKNTLRMHMYKHDGKSYSCNVCGKSTGSRLSLQSHIKYMHELVPQFACTLCNKSFKKAVTLKEHLTIHTGAVLYTCPHCPKTFNFKSNMHSHRKKKHREEWEANRRFAKKLVSNETN